MTAWLKAGTLAKGKVCSNDENNSIVLLTPISFLLIQKFQCKTLELWVVSDSTVLVRESMQKVAERSVSEDV